MKGEGSRRPTVFGLAVLAWLIAEGLMPVPALAIQEHGALEGLTVHLVAHLLYGAAMLGFALRIRRSRLAARRPWRLMAVGALLLALWNGWAFIAHVLSHLVPPGDFLTGVTGYRSRIIMRSAIDWLYYLFKMDHLVTVPALALILAALTGMNREKERNNDNGNRS